MRAEAGTLFGCIEAGGTKFVCAVADERRRLISRTRIPTGNPDTTMDRVIAFLHKSQSEHGRLAAMGVASFGPIGLDRSSSDWGLIMNSPKDEWNGASMILPIRDAFDVPIGLDTDVNAAALGEAVAAEPNQMSALVYVTIGTGIGGGAVFRGQAIHGSRHPEMGHILPRRHPLDGKFAGCCPYHGDCMEGLASGTAIVARWGGSLSELGVDHEANEIIAWYIGQFTATIMASFSPSRVVLGGGVMATPGLLARVRHHADRFARGYLAASGSMIEIIQRPSLGDNAGLMGALLLAKSALQATR